jgi:D-glycero-D-manno-heptose 1,7-bisphosphate phosphatase
LENGLAKIIFLDRDGTINRELPEYVKRWEEFEFLPTVLDALRLWRAEGFKCFVVTNQSCVERKLVTAERVREILDRMCREVESAGGKIEKAYFCPHAPEVSSCACRKPAPGMYEQAALEFGFDLSQAYSIGDMERDVEVGKLLRQPTILVRSGKGVDYDEGSWSAEPDYVVDDLLAAARLTVELERKNHHVGLDRDAAKS